MKICNKCGNEFPFSIKIDGVVRNLKNRSYCLECSPYNLHNTKKLFKDGDIKGNCLNCDNGLQGNQTKFCSNKCKSVFSEKTSKSSYFYQTLRGLERKLILVNMKGGSCEGCGYKNNISALEFHHKDSDDKKMTLDMRRLGTSNWDIILLEFEKCELLCANCHREKHYPENTKENIEMLISENPFKHKKKKSDNL